MIERMFFSCLCAGVCMLFLFIGIYIGYDLHKKSDK